MKSLHDYIVYEKLNLNNVKKIVRTDTISIDLPKILQGEGEVIPNEIWKNITVPSGKYLIYHDKYRGNKLHFSELGDFILNVCWYEDDYEDFKFEGNDSDIIFSSNDFEETFKWYCGYLHIDLNSYDSSMTDDDIADLLDETNYKNVKDSDEFFINLISGKWSEKEFSGEMNEMLDFTKDNIKEQIIKYFS